MLENACFNMQHQQQKVCDQALIADNVQLPNNANNAQNGNEALIHIMNPTTVSAALFTTSLC